MGNWKIYSKRQMGRGLKMIIKEKVKENAKFNEKRLNVSKDFIERLEIEVKTIVEKACRRAKENSRNTVMGRDL